MTVNTTGSVNFVVNAITLTATGSMAINNNSVVTGFSKTGAGTVTFFSTTTANSVNGATVSNSSNNISNITLTGATGFTGINNTDGASSSNGPVKTINGNTFNNISGGTGTMNPMTVNFSGASSTVNSNTISNITWGAATTCLTLGSSNQATLTVSGNIIDPIATTAGAVVGLTSAAPTANITGNTIFGLSSSAAVSVTGMSVTDGTTVNVSKNKIYDLSGSNAASTVNGLLISAGTPVTVFNNLIGNLTAPAANTSNAINGINLTSTQTNSTIKVYYNTVYLSNPTSGTGFGSSGIFHTVSTTATTAALDLRNNIIVNTSVQNGAGLTVAYRRSGGAASNLANYATTSNNNDFYAGTPSATNLIYSDGTSSAQTITAYKNGVFTAGTIAPRDSASFSENPTFLSTTGSSANFLHMDPSVSTRIESGGANIAGITDDFDGDTRQGNGGYSGTGTAPDVGADEYEGAQPDLTAPAISYTPLGNTNSFAARTLVATITDATGVPTSGTGLPVLYWKINAGSYTAATATSLGSNQYQFTFGAGVGLGNTVSYYVVAQDSAATPNVSANPSTGASGFTFNPPAASTPPITPLTPTVILRRSTAPRRRRGGKPTLR